MRGVIALATIAICVALVAIADSAREQARAEQMTAQACAICTERRHDCSAVCGGAGGKPRESTEADGEDDHRAPDGGRRE